MQITKSNKVIQFCVDLKLKTCLLLSSGRTGEFADSEIEKTPDNSKVYINGYVWASLIKRALSRLNETEAMVQCIDGTYANKKSVSALWCEASFIDLNHGTEIVHGIKIHRKWGTTQIGALYSNEVIPPGLSTQLKFNWFCNNEDNSKIIKENLISAFSIINEGIETIGAGWSYGYGRIDVCEIKARILELADNINKTQEIQKKMNKLEDTKKKQRNNFQKQLSELEGVKKLLWSFEEGLVQECKWDNQLAIPTPTTLSISKPWKKFIVEAKILEGQLMAVTTSIPPADLSSFQGEKLPDTFIFRRKHIDNNSVTEKIVIPGKTIRQTVFSSAIERRLRSEGKTICLDTTQSANCNCERCTWFGATDKRSIISIADAVVDNAETITLNRIQLCEHSMQNIQLFAGEYLKKGNFTFEIIVDCRNSNNEEEQRKSYKKSLKKLIENIKALCNEMKAESQAPPGWYRLGATTTCTGQIEVKCFKEQFFPDKQPPDKQPKEETICKTMKTKKKKKKKKNNMKKVI